MANRTLNLIDALYDYIVAHSVREQPVQRRCAMPPGRPSAGMQIGPNQGQFMALLVRQIGVRQALEIGTFTGYSALTVARGAAGRRQADRLRYQPRIHGRRPAPWQEAGNRRSYRSQDRAGGGDPGRPDGGRAAGRFDFAFIDADKASYDPYYERCLNLVRPGGPIAIDNVLWSGAVAEPRPPPTPWRCGR